MKLNDIAQVRKEVTDFFDSKEKFADIDGQGRIELKQFGKYGNEIIAEVLNMHKKQLLVIADIALTNMELKKKRRVWQKIK